MFLKIIWLFLKVLLVLLLLLGIHLYKEFALISKDYISNKYPNLAYYDYQNKVFVSPKQIVTLPDKVRGGSMNFMRFASPSPNAPTKPLPKVMLSSDSFAKTPEQLALYWLGHSTALIEISGVRLLVDPVFANAAFFPGIVPRYDSTPLTREQLPALDAVLITHDHYDHLERSSILYLKERNVIFVAPLGVAERLRKWGVADSNIRELGWDESTNIKGVQVTAMTASHFSGRSPIRNRTLWAAYGLKSADKNIFWSGDTGYSEHFAEIGRKYGPFDLAAMEMDAWNPGWPNTHLFPDEVVRAAQDLNAQQIMPIHWAVFDLALHPWQESVEMLVTEAQKLNIPLATPKLGEKFVPGTTVTSYWWR